MLHCKNWDRILLVIKIHENLTIINAVSGLMNTVQEPASEVAYTLVVPREDYQKTSGLQSLSHSLVSIGSPLIASAFYGMSGLDAVILFDLLTFGAAFVTLAWFIDIPEVDSREDHPEQILRLAREGLRFLRENPLVLHMILFMSGVNFIASAFDAVLPALVISRAGTRMLGIVTSCSGMAMVLGSVLTTLMPRPRDRIRVIYLTMLFSLGTENFLLAFSPSPAVWCVGQILGWLLVPVMSASQNVIMRTVIPVSLQGRVYACRNTLQFFTIPVGLGWGGFMVDVVCEPLMSAHARDWLSGLFGTGKGSGAALMMFILGAAGILWCILYGRKLRKYRYAE